MKVLPELFRRRGAPAESSCGVAFRAETGEVVVAERTADGAFRVSSVPLQENRAVNVVEAEIRTAVLGWSAHTDRSQLISGTGADDETVLRALVEGVKNIPNATATSFAWARTPDQKITITQAERHDVERTTRELGAWLARQWPPHFPSHKRGRLRVETATHALVRLWLKDAAALRPEARTVAFLTAGREGYAVGLWGQETGLIYETEELFEDEASPEMAAAHICESVAKLFAPASLARLGLAPLSCVVVAPVAALAGTLIELLRHESGESLEIERAGFAGPAGEWREVDQATALALGALLDDARVPRIDLASELEADYLSLVRAKEERALAEEGRQTSRAKVALFAPFLFGAGVLLAFYLDLWREAARLRAETAVEQRRGETLRAEATLRVAAKDHFAEYVALTNQTLDLRRRQPATAQLLNDLNQQWPSGDPSWFISEMKTAAGGAVEFKGRTKREESVTAFTHGLEFSNGLFTSISNNIQTANSAGGALAGSVPPGAPDLEFTVRAVYTPLQLGNAAPGPSPDPSSMTAAGGRR